MKQYSWKYLKLVYNYIKKNPVLYYKTLKYDLYCVLTLNIIKPITVALDG
jgi:hypothetical protein